MIELCNISKKLGSKQLFADFSITIPDNSFVIITGESGCGKTTLLNIIGGIEHADSGNILFNGKDIKNYSKRIFYRDEVGFLFQNFALIENQSVEHNLMLLPRKAQTHYDLHQALDLVGLNGYEKKKVYQLSGGEQQRVALARLILKKSNVILADEPTGSLDERNSSIVMQHLHAFNKQSKTVIMVTHDKSLLKDATMTIDLNEI